jgi:hypothetical protein
MLYIMQKTFDMISTTSWITTLFKSVDVHFEHKW